jgi:hypothetical protein
VPSSSWQRWKTQLTTCIANLSTDLMADRARDELDAFRQEAGLSHGELWFRYFELGGMKSGLELEAVLYGVFLPSDHERDVIAHAINERFVELGKNHPVAYSKDLKPDAERPA